MKRFTFCYCAWLLLFSSANGQNSFWSNTGLVSIKPGAYLSINGDAYNRDSGYYYNSDSIFVTGNWTHNAPNRCFDSTGTGWVYLYADTQHINGISSTHFNNLILKNQGIKFGDIDVYVDDTLNLTDRELRMDTNTVWVYNPDTGAVVRTAGYVSSLQNGGLLRRTDTTLPYFFAVGSDSGTFRFRPVVFQPQASGINLYKVRFANVNPSNEGFNIADKYALVCQVNPNWYHRFFHVAGNDPADITIMFDTAADGNWNEIVHWQTVPEWQPIYKNIIIPGTPFFQISKYSWNDYVYSPFAIAITSDSFAFANNTGPYCSYDTISLLARPNGMASYVWQGPDSFSSNQQNPTLPAQGSGGIYTLTISNTYGCSQTASTTVVVNAAPLASATNTGPYCSYDAVSLQSAPDGMASYIWQGPGSFTSNEQNPTLSAQEAAGAYTLTVKDNNGCTSSSSTTVTVNPAPVAIAGTDTTIWRPDTIQLNGSGGVSGVWSPDVNLSCSACYAPYAWPDSSIYYYLTVTSNEGCKATDSILITVTDVPIANFFIPNVITPNGDGYNDTWVIPDLEAFPQNEARIINRWGDEVFYQSPYQNKWDGTWNGQKLPGATYYYVLRVFYEGQWIKFDGPLTIIR